MNGTKGQNKESSEQTDATILATYMILEAASLDLGTVWITYFDKEKAKGLGKSATGIYMLYIGYPAANFVPNTKPGCHRKPLEETVL